MVWLLVWGWELFRPADFGAEAVAAGTLSLLIVPITLGVAILRYRLYDIDHLVSRTVSYAVLVALLGGAYFGAVIGIQTLFPSSEDLAVAGTTLAAAAVFNPLRLRIQDLMDRRFNRRRFDAERVIEAFTAKISTVTQAETLSSGPHPDPGAHHGTDLDRHLDQELTEWHAHHGRDLTARRGWLHHPL